MNNLKEMIKNEVHFLHYQENNLWYETECGFKFPVPISDTGTAYFNNKDKGMFFMRWIRQHLKFIENSKQEQLNTI